MLSISGLECAHLPPFPSGTRGRCQAEAFEGEDTFQARLALLLPLASIPSFLQDKREWPDMGTGHLLLFINKVSGEGKKTMKGVIPSDAQFTFPP